MGVHCDRKRDENNERNNSIRREGSYALYMLSGKSAKKNRNVVKEGEIACFYRREEPRGKNRIGRETKRQRERERDAETLSMKYLLIKKIRVDSVR